MDHQILTVEEAAAYLRTSPTALHSQRSRGQEPGTLGVLVGRRLCFRKSTIDAWLEGREATGPSRVAS